MQTNPDTVMRIPLPALQTYMNKTALKIINHLNVNRSILAQASIDYVVRELSKSKLALGTHLGVPVLVEQRPCWSRDAIQDTLSQYDNLKFHLIGLSIFGPHKFIPNDVNTICSDWAFSAIIDLSHHLSKCFDKKAYYYVMSADDSSITIGVTNDQSTFTKWLDNHTSSTNF